MNQSGESMGEGGRSREAGSSTKGRGSHAPPIARPPLGAETRGPAKTGGAEPSSTSPGRRGNLRIGGFQKVHSPHSEETAQCDNRIGV